MKKERNFTVAEKHDGVYNISGDILPIQIIDNSRLSAAENLWLKNLSNRLDEKSFNLVLNEVCRKDKMTRIEAYLNVLAQANHKVLEEVMMNSTLALDEVFIRTGMAARWEARKALSIAQNMINLGFPIETVISVTNLDPEEVESLLPSVNPASMHT